LTGRPEARAGERPRLQMFVSDLGATGVVRNAIGIANAAARSGFDVRLLTCVADGELKGELDAEVALVDLLSGVRGGGQRKHRQRRAFLPYRRHTREWRPDLLFSAGNHGHLLSTLAWAGLPGCRILRISNALEQQGGEPGSRGWLRDVKFRSMVARANRLVLVSNALAAEPLLAPRVASGHAVIIANGVDIERVRRGAAQACSHPWLRERDVPIVLAVGRHVPQKNFDVLVQGLALARREKPVRLLFLGEGKEEAVARLKRLAEQLGVAPHVAFEPPSPNPFSYMAAADLFALPSLWEGSSNVLLEALACGTPIVASRTAGDAELILEGGRFGLLADPTDPDDWAGAILRQLSSDRVLAGDRANRFSRQAALASYLALFDECGRLSPRR
jgi:glycosyltransferase involved in cell wall biosynthesis